MFDFSFDIVYNRLLPKLPNARENVTPGGQDTAFLELGGIFAYSIPISEETKYKNQDEAYVWT